MNRAKHDWVIHNVSIMDNLHGAAARSHYPFLKFNTWTEDAVGDAASWVRNRLPTTLTTFVYIHRTDESTQAYSKFCSSTNTHKDASVGESCFSASSARPKMSEAYIAGRVWGDKRTRLKMSECHPLPWQPAKFGRDWSASAKGQITC